ncbi:hypothetical protein, partial [Brevibacterium aurantiacum]|uniref:hypothetical protein n=1 Tax=Brevibacterium aurantiacum TaxID=273384 RepID=UPI001C60D651
RGAPFLNGNVDFEHHHFPSSEGAFPFHARLDPATRIGGSRLRDDTNAENVADRARHTRSGNQHTSTSVV